MKKTLCGAILIFLLGGCYTPMNNSGVATTKPWLEVSGKKIGFDGKQYDSCYRFNLRFWPQEAADNLNLQETCISACCWRSEKEEVVLDFNRNFDADMLIHGRARKYSPARITLQIDHSNLLNTTKVTVSPKGAISNNGLVNLSYKEYENPARLAQIAKNAQALANSLASAPAEKRQTVKNRAVKTPKQSSTPKESDTAKALVQRQAGAKIDTYFYQMDKSYKKQGAVFLLSERILHARKTADPDLYAVSCQAKARTGLDVQHLRASTFSCGLWNVNVTEGTVEPDDKRAHLIWGK